MGIKPVFMLELPERSHCVSLTTMNHLLIYK